LSGRAAKIEGETILNEPSNCDQDTKTPADFELLRSKIQSFDPVSLWSRVAADMDLLRELVSLFTEEAFLMLSAIETAGEAGDAAGLYKFSHKLRGSVLQFSAHAVAATAGTLEEIGRVGSLEGASALVPQLKAETCELVDELKLMVSPEAL
jgi:HPt (histidine-containing phosphotransfer) domain-containing protein